MRHWSLPTALLIVALLCPGAAATERILDYHADIQIQHDDSIEVRETIRVHSEGESIRHGIFRDFPTSYTDILANPYKVGFDILSVRRDGQPEAYAISDLSDGVRIKIGSPSTELAPGDYTYELTYRAQHELGFFKDFDELYWNVTGIRWLFPIDQASATVTLPKPVAADQLRLAGYTGFQASHDHNLTITRLNDTQVSFVTTVPLLRAQGLSIAIGFPKGVVNEPTAAQRAAGVLAENATFGVALVGFAILLVYYLIAWMMVGRDPRPGVIVVSYEPPPRLSPAALCYLQHMGYSDRVFVSAAVDLAVKRYLKIEQEGSVYRLKKLRSEDGGLPAEEINLLRILFRNNPEIDLLAEASPSIQTAVKTLKQDLDLQENQELYQKNRSAALVGVVISVLTLTAMVFTLPPSKQFVAGFLSLWLSIWTCAVYALISGTIKAWNGKSIAAISATFGTLVLTAAEVGALTAFSFTFGLWAAAGLALILATNAIFIHLLRTLTPEGRQLMDQIEGFRQFLTTVDSDRLQRSGPAKTPALFEKCLPYALALGVELEWARQFEGVLAQAATAQGTGGTYSPVWFSGGDMTGFNAATFASSFAGGFTSAVSSSSSPPGSSSGSGGGGSSGGGGGGGGGGGW